MIKTGLPTPVYTGLLTWIVILSDRSLYCSAYSNMENLRTVTVRSTQSTLRNNPLRPPDKTCKTKII